MSALMKGSDALEELFLEASKAVTLEELQSKNQQIQERFRALNLALKERAPILVSSVHRNTLQANQLRKYAEMAKLPFDNLLKTIHAIKKRDKKFMEKKLTTEGYTAPPLPEVKPAPAPSFYNVIDDDSEEEKGDSDQQGVLKTELDVQVEQLLMKRTTWKQRRSQERALN